MRKVSGRGMLVLALAVMVLAAVPLLADGGPLHQVKQTPPIKMGTSGGSVADISRLFCCSGTLGSLVRYDGTLSILSNNHILARSGSARNGEDAIQPGLVDSNCSSASSNIVGDFAGDKVPLGSANVDAAISTARSNVDSTGAIIDIGIPCSNPVSPALGMAVTKSGRTTGQTFGSIQSINTSVSVQYQKGCGTGRQFVISYTNQIITGAMSSGGDSGSLLVAQGTPNPVGLLYAGNSSSTVYNPIQDVINAFQAKGHTFTFVGNTCAAATGVQRMDMMGQPSAMGGQPMGGTNRPSDNDIDFARVIKERHEPDLFALQGVIGVGVGMADKDPTEAVINVYVETPKGGHPKDLPTELDGVKVKVIATEPFVAY